MTLCPLEVYFLLPVGKYFRNVRLVVLGMSLKYRIGFVA